MQQVLVSPEAFKAERPLVKIAKQVTESHRILRVRLVTS